MNRKKVNLHILVLFALFFCVITTNGMAFSETPTYTDPGGDSSPICTDILKVWVDHNATFLQFKIELNGSVNQYVWPLYMVHISIDNSTGSSSLGFDLPIDYKIEVGYTPTGVLYTYFNNLNNGTYHHTDPLGAGLLYYSISNNNHTLEFGYKMQTGDPGDSEMGFLNVSIGQTIFLKFQGDTDSDYVPDSTSLIRYVLTEETGGIPGFTLPFLSFAVFAMITYYFLAKKKTLI